MVDPFRRDRGLRWRRYLATGGTGGMVTRSGVTEFP